MKKFIIIFLLLFGCAQLQTKDTLEETLRDAEETAATWTDYADMGDGNIVDTDTFLVLDASDTTLDPTGTQKEYQWGDVKLDLDAAGYGGDITSVLGDSSGDVPVFFQTWATIGADGTPDVSAATNHRTTTTTEITDFDGTPVDGQQLWVYNGAATPYDLTTSGIESWNRTTDYTASVGEILVFVYRDTQWYALNIPDEVVTISDTGFITRTGAGTAAARDLTNTNGEIDITNPAGVAGDPVLDLDVTPSSGNATLEVAEDALQVSYDSTMTESASGLGVVGVVLDDNTAVEIMADADGMDDTEYNGITITGKNCGETLTALATVSAHDDTDIWHYADANVAGDFPAIGLAIAACTDTNEAIILVRGVVRNEAWTGLTIGGAVYLSLTAGGITQTAPPNSGDAVQIIGWAISDSEIYFDFSRPYSEVE